MINKVPEYITKIQLENKYNSEIISRLLKITTDNA